MYDTKIIVHPFLLGSSEQRRTSFSEYSKTVVIYIGQRRRVKNWSNTRPCYLLHLTFSGSESQGSSKDLSYIYGHLKYGLKRRAYTYNKLHFKWPAKTKWTIFDGIGITIRWYVSPKAAVAVLIDWLDHFFFNVYIT
jgi:hypothetical protein